MIEHSTGHVQEKCVLHVHGLLFFVNNIRVYIKLRLWYLITTIYIYIYVGVCI